MITIMNMFNILYSTHLKYVNIILHVDKCVVFTFAPLIIPVIYVPCHDLTQMLS